MKFDNKFAHKHCYCAALLKRRISKNNTQLIQRIYDSSVARFMPKIEFPKKHIIS